MNSNPCNETRGRDDAAVVDNQKEVSNLCAASGEMSAIGPLLNNTKCH